MTLEAIINQNKFFSNLDQSIFNNFLKNARPIKCDKGKVLFQQDDKAEYFYFIQKGWIKLFKQTLDGSEAVIDVINDTHIFGETALFNDHHYTLSAEVVEPSELISIPINILDKAISDTPQVAIKMLKVMSTHNKRQDIELENRDIKNAPQRIGCFLMRLCPYPYDQEDITLHLPYDKTLIASRLGMKAETFSRALNKLKESKHIIVKGSTVIIPSLNKIKQYSCSVCSSVYPCGDL